ncbi:MAG: hypothetical protein JWO47_573 [Candidatus Saccharibacteria bacterium]|nr:hypothetical protein [Candidatus Saccharibacteria bacterium]
MNLILFVPAYRYKTDKLTDISYALSFVVLITLALGQSRFKWEDFLLALMIFWWVVRLGGFLLFRIWKKGKDKRFDGMRENPVKFLRFWFFQGVTVFVVLIGALEFMHTNRPVFNVLSAIGLVIFLKGLIIEAVADLQKWQFSQDPKNKGKWIEAGLWGMSRHPNYLGEMLVWLGVYLYILPSLHGLQWLIALISPAYIIILLMYVSGIPILEKSADKKWGSNKDYNAYKKRVPLLVPWTNQLRSK